MSDRDDGTGRTWLSLGDTIREHMFLFLDGYEKMEEAGIMCPVVSVCCHYESMTKFGEVVEISPTIEKFNGIRFVISYEVREKQTKELRCTGESSHCFLGRKGHPVNLKKASPDFYTMFSNLAESKGASFGPS